MSDEQQQQTAAEFQRAKDQKTSDDARRRYAAVEMAYGREEADRDQAERVREAVRQTKLDHHVVDEALVAEGARKLAIEKAEHERLVREGKPTKRLA